MSKHTGKHPEKSAGDWEKAALEELSVTKSKIISSIWADLADQSDKLAKLTAEVVRLQSGLPSESPVIDRYRLFIAIEHIHPDGSFNAITDPPKCVGDFASERDAGDCFDLLLMVGRKHKGVL